ncbi:hypothetical protein LOAG_03243 [Loa loa]|uniref:Uncharacterized protein n=1 Tax=Loa loa TaxID=7209 RepID=A0A1S0U6P5_LOALO|nr:hypothetical protein LOAG_03243 [Loa loa]EFO25243.1 hypothetical protein LOAG_03243 [Loa loa]
MSVNVSVYICLPVCLSVCLCLCVYVSLCMREKESSTDLFPEIFLIVATVYIKNLVILHDYLSGCMQTCVDVSHKRMWVYVNHFPDRANDDDFKVTEIGTNRHVGTKRWIDLQRSSII